MTRRLAILALIGLLTLACKGGGGGGDAEPEAAMDAAASAPDAAAVPQATGDDSEQTGEIAPLERRTVEVYFPSTLGDGLIGEYSEIFATITPGDRIKQILADLISGPQNPDALRAVPQGTVLRQAYVLKNGVAYLDFSRDLVEGISGGSMEELLTVYSIMNSVAMNVPEVRRIGILVEGEPIESLNGHIDLRHPLRPDPSLVLAPVVVDEDGSGEAVRTADIL